MLIGLVVGIIIFLLIWWSNRKNTYYDHDFAMALIFWLLVSSSVGLLLISLPASYFLSEKITIEHNIKAMQDGSETSGSFFLGSGTIDDEPSFMYYQETENGFELKDIEAEYVKIVETNGIPKVVETCDDFRNISNWLTAPIDWFSNGKDCYGDVIFYVPEGSIRNDYVLDAK